MKKILSFTFALSLTLVLCVSALAQELYTYDSEYDYSAPQAGSTRVNDDADLLTDGQESALQAKIDSIIAAYNFDVVLHTTNSIGNKSIADYADDYFDYNGFGFGENRNGLLFMLNMNNGEEGNRDYYTSTRGYGKYVFTDYAIYDSDSAVNEAILPYLREGEWYNAFDKYLDVVEDFLLQASTGTPYDYETPYKTYDGGIDNGDSMVEELYDNRTGQYIKNEVIALIVAIVVAVVVVSVFKGQMKTNVKAAGAADYVVPGTLNIEQAHDHFTHASVAKTAKPKETSSSGSSSHTSSSGASHGGGGGKF